MSKDDLINSIEQNDYYYTKQILEENPGILANFNQFIGSPLHIAVIRSFSHDYYRSKGIKNDDLPIMLFAKGKGFLVVDNIINIKNQNDLKDKINTQLTVWNLLE